MNGCGENCCRKRRLVGLIAEIWMEGCLQNCTGALVSTGIGRKSTWDHCLPHCHCWWSKMQRGHDDVSQPLRNKNWYWGTTLQEVRLDWNRGAWYRNNRRCKVCMLFVLSVCSSPLMNLCLRISILLWTVLVSKSVSQ